MTIDPRVAEVLGALSSSEVEALVKRDQEQVEKNEERRAAIKAQYPHVEEDSIVFGDKHGVATYITCKSCGKSTNPESDNHSPQGRIGAQMKRADGRNYTSDLHHAGGQHCLACKVERKKSRKSTTEANAFSKVKEETGLSAEEILEILRNHKLS